jgi:hypothetical protein
MDFHFENEDMSEESSNPDNTRLVNLQSSDVRVKAAATNLNRSVKSFNIFRDRLRAHRRRALAIAMREFRSKYQRPFNQEKERVRQVLHTYRDIVLNIEPDLDLVDLQGLLAQDNTHASVRRQDPMRASFWFY